MGAVTTHYSLPYPVLSDAPNVPTDVQGLAVAVDNSLWAVRPLDVQVTDSVVGTTTSASYVSALTGTSALVTTFVAARTTAEVTVSTFVTNSGASGPLTQYIAPQVTGSGFTTYGPVDADAAIGQWTNNNVAGTVSRTTIITGLTPGVTYTVTAFMKVTGSTGSFNFRRIIIR